MKILVKGNVKALGSVCSMHPSYNVEFVKEPNDKDYDIILYGDIELDSILIQNETEPIYCTGDIFSYSMSKEEILEYRKRKEAV